MTQMLQHKGYYGSVEASTEDNCLYGKVLFIQALINYEGETVKELQDAFIEAVDDYIETCKKESIEPEKPFKGSFNVRPGPERHAKIAMAVQQLGIKSINEFINQVIDHELDRLGPR